MSSSVRRDLIRRMRECWRRLDPTETTDDPVGMMMASKLLAEASAFIEGMQIDNEESLSAVDYINRVRLEWAMACDCNCNDCRMLDETILRVFQSMRNGTLCICEGPQKMGPGFHRPDCPALDHLRDPPPPPPAPSKRKQSFMAPFFPWAELAIAAGLLGLLAWFLWSPYL